MTPVKVTEKGGGMGAGIFRATVRALLITLLLAAAVAAYFVFR